jgi:hypothetical protein
MPTNALQRLVPFATAALVAVFVSLNLYGALTNNDLWLYQAWAFTPFWFLVLWSAVAVGFVYCLWTYHDAIANACESTRVRWAFLIALVVVLVGFHYDSFVFGSGNFAIAQIAQVQTIHLRPDIFGAQAVVAALFWLLSAIGLHANTAGFWGWRLYAVFCAALGIWGIVRLARAVAPGQVRSIFFTAVAIFAGPFLLFCGYVGVEPIVVPATVWFSLAAYRLAERFSLSRLGAVWGIVLIAGLATVMNAFLVPAAVCVTIASTWRRPKNWLIAGLSGLLVMGILIFLLYLAAARSMAVSNMLVMPGGKLPLIAYSLTSIQNLLDKALVVLAAAPLAPLLIVLVWRRLESSADRIFAATIVVAVIAGRSAQMVLDPSAGLVLDFPRLTAFLMPLSIALAFFLDRRFIDKTISSRFRMMIAGLCVLLPLSIAPVFTKIGLVDPLAKALAERHDVYYRTTGLAFRDALFYNRDLAAANAWEWSLPIKSPDFLSMRGCYDLVANNQTGDVIVSLYRLIARQPYWSEPRSLLATVQLQIGRPEMAKPQIDTCLQLDPYGKQHLINLYRYEQAIGRIDSSLAVAERTSVIFPNDHDISTDVMLIAMRAGQTERADSLADVFLSADTTEAYPHMIKGRIAEQKQLIDSALAEFRRFLRYAPIGSPDIELVGEHVAELTRLKSQP